jgi:hypothetical protein
MLSLILWLVVSTFVTAPTPITWSLALSAQGLDSTKYLVVSEIPSSQTFFLKVAQEEVNLLGRQNPSGIIDLRNVQPGKRRYPIEVVPSIARKFFPEDALFVMLDIEPVMNRRIKVDLEASGELSDSTLRIEQTVTDPEYVSLSGPKPDVQKVIKVRGILDLSRVQPGVREYYDVDLEALGEGNVPLPRVHLDPDKIRVQPVLSPADGEKTVFVIPTFTGKTAEGFGGNNFTVEPSKISVTGGSLELASLTKVQTQPVDLTGLKADTTVRVPVILPKGVSSLTKSVMVTIRVSATSLGDPPPAVISPTTGSTGQ